MEEQRYHFHAIPNLDWSRYHSKDIPWDGDVDPFEKAATQLLRMRGRSSVRILRGRGVGASHFGGMIALEYLDYHARRDEEVVVVILGVKEDQVYRTGPWNYVKQEYKKYHHLKDAVVTENTLKLAPNKYITAFPVGYDDPTKVQGFMSKHMLFVVEDLNVMHKAMPEVLDNILTGPHNKLLVLDGAWAELDGPPKFRDSRRLKTFRASAYDHPNVQTGLNLIPGAVNRFSIDEAKKRYGSEIHPLMLMNYRAISIPREDQAAKFSREEEILNLQVEKISDRVVKESMKRLILDYDVAAKKLTHDLMQFERESNGPRRRNVCQTIAETQNALAALRLLFGRYEVDEAQLKLLNEL